MADTYDASAELLALFRHSLRATGFGSDLITVQLTTTTSHNATDRDGDRGQLLWNIEYSRRLVASYNVVLLILLLGFAVHHWVHLLSHRRSSRHAESHTHQHRIDARKSDGDQRSDRTSSSAASATSSSSSTLVAKDATETQPLLGSRSESYPSSSTIKSRINGWLMYQPADMPFFNKQLPSNLTSLTISACFGLNIFYLFYRMPLNLARTEYLIADRAGTLFAANLPILYILGAKNSPVRHLTGLSYENLNIFHRRLGEWLTALAVLHASLMVLVWYRVLYIPLGFSFWALLRTPLIYLGAIAFVSYLVLYFTSLASFRQRFYEIFLVSHILLQSLGLVFLYLHHTASRNYCLAALFVFVVDRAVFRHTRNRWRAKADLSVLPDGETVHLSIPLPASPTARKHKWQPSEHVFLSLPTLRHGHFLQAHPFTIASPAPSSLPSPTTDTVDEQCSMDFIIRARDGFSAALLRIATDTPSPSDATDTPSPSDASDTAASSRPITLAVDGAYGSHHALHMVRGVDTAVLVAGGSGIAVTLPLAWDLGLRLGRPAAGRDGKRVVLIWVVHDQRHLQWVDAERLEALRRMGVEVVIPSATKDAGRPDVCAMIDRIIATGKEEGGQKTRQRMGVVVSGPDGMNRAVRNKCAALVGRGRRVEVAVEKFGW